MTEMSAPADAGPEDAGPEDAGPEEVGPKEPGPEEVRPEQASPHDSPAKTQSALELAPIASETGSQDLNFVDTPRMRLEELIGEMTVMGQQVVAAQSRLRALIRANARIAAELRSESVLKAVVAEACELVNAEHAALGVLDTSGRFDQFVHSGLGATHIAQPGESLYGSEVLGLLAAHEGPLRLSNLKEHPAAMGAPSNHPPLKSFLGVPIRVRDRVYGSLFALESRGGEFSAEDEQLLTALATTAAVAVQNAQLYQRSERQRMWLTASADMTQHLFSHRAEDPLDVVISHAATGANADSATLVLKDGDEGWSVHAASGQWEVDLVGLAVRSDDTFMGGIIASGMPAMTEDYAAEYPQVVLRHHIPPLYGPIMGVPLKTGNGTLLGVLAVSRRPGRAKFTREDLEHLSRYSGYVGVTMELDQARAAREASRQREDHQRIAADLHDHVVQELFATGIGLQNLAPTLGTSQRAKVLGYVEALDDAAHHVRASIFRLRSNRRDPDSLRLGLHSIAVDVEEALGFVPTVEMTGSLDRDLGGELAEDVLAVVREGLSNVARHAQATSAEARVDIVDEVVTIDITDNGRGIRENAHESGLANMRHRAEIHHGSLVVLPAAPRGTHVRWTAHLG